MTALCVTSISWASNWRNQHPSLPQHERGSDSGAHSRCSRWRFPTARRSGRWWNLDRRSLDLATSATPAIRHHATFASRFELIRLRGDELQCNVHMHAFVRNKKKDVSLRGTSLGQSSQSRPSQVVKSTEVYTLSPYITSSHRVCARNYNNIQVRIMQLLANIFQPINLTRPNVYLQYLKSVNAAERLCSIPFDGDVRQRFALKTHTTGDWWGWHVTSRVCVVVTLTSCFSSITGAGSLQSPLNVKSTSARSFKSSAFQPKLNNCTC